MNSRIVIRFGNVLQILKTLAYLSLPDINVVHCDLKPENILFVNASRSAIKVIDFGSSCYANKTTYTYARCSVTRFVNLIVFLFVYPKKTT